MMLSLIFRTVGAWGAGKGSDLTPAEIDGNFYEIKQAVEDLQDNPTLPSEISNITVTGSQMTIWLENGDFFGPYTLPSAPATIPVVTKSGATLTPALADRNTYMRCTAAGGCVVTLDDDAAVDFPIGAELHFRQDQGQITFEAVTGVTINGVAGFLDATAGAGAVATLKKVAANEWDLFGLLAPDVSA
jgi:hypothetical protein